MQVALDIMSWKMVMIQQMMMIVQMASTVALHLLSQLDARHGHHPVQGLQQGGDDHADGDNVFLLHLPQSSSHNLAIKSHTIIPPQK